MPFFYASLHSTLLCLPIYCVTVMKKLLTLTVILYSLIFSSVSFGEWSEFGELAEGHTVYLDVEGMKIHNGYRYLWVLTDFLEPDEWGTLSNKSYHKVDCKEFRVQILQYVFYKQPMGEGSGEPKTSSIKDWKYPSPNSISELIIELVCEKEISTQ